MLKRAILITALTFGGSAFAADMALKAPPPVAVPVSNWTGCYIGGNLGGGWSHKYTTETNVNGTPLDLDLASTQVDGWTYGGQIGCDYQFASSWVAGIRGMWDGASMTGTSGFALPANGLNFNNYKINEFGTVVGTFGYLVNPAVELYGLAGFAWTHDALTFTSPNGPFAYGTQNRSGYAVGAGVSWLFAPRWNVFVEYNYLGFGTKALTMPGEGSAAGGFYTASVKQDVNTAVVGVNYRFGH